jgi:iron-sulfur cluster repair protein YtfE (RIC family)
MSTPRAVFRSVTDYLRVTHDAQEDLLMEIRDALDVGRFEAAEERYLAYEASLHRHLRLEESMLFARIEAISSAMAREVARLRQEHDEIRKALTAMHRAVMHRDSAAFTRAYDALGSVLPGHELREERVVYPALDRAMSPDEREALASMLASHASQGA